MRKPEDQSKVEPETTASAEHLRMIGAVLQHIHAELAVPLSLEQLAQVAGISAPHLSSVFRAVMGESVHQHIKRIRLERGASLLRYTEDSVKSISLSCGYESHEAFTRTFTTAFGDSPTKFRKRQKVSLLLPAQSDVHYQAASLPAEFRPAPDLGRTLQVDFVELPQLHLACRRHQGPYEKATAAWTDLLWWCWRAGRLRSDLSLYGIAYDDDSITPPDKLRYDAGIAVEPQFTGDGNTLPVTVAGGLFARCSVRGTFADYWRVSSAFLYQWLPASGYVLREWYLLDKYHLPQGDFRHPMRLIGDVLWNYHVDIHLPIAPGPRGAVYSSR